METLALAEIDAVVETHLEWAAKESRPFGAYFLTAHELVTDLGRARRGKAGWIGGSASISPRKS